jgi:hypothetical protein
MTVAVREPVSAITEDDLLHFAIKWVKENREDGSDFVSEVAVVLEILRSEMRGPASLIESQG